jgi:hypothetical protein
MSSERFVRVFLAVLTAALGALACANLALDPYRAYRVFELAGLRPYRDKLVSRIAKAEILEHERCEVVILGTSRAQIALDPAHPVWGAPACNLALTGMGAAELEQVIASVRRHPEVRRWVIALDFASFGRGSAPHDDFARSRFDPELSAFDYHVGLLLGGAASDASLRLLRDWRRRRPAPYGELGLTDPALRGEVGDRKRFVWALERTVEPFAGPEPFAYDPGLVAPLVRAIRSARAAGIETTALILPSHALYYEAFQRFGYWRDYERWLRDLTEALEPEAEARIAALWDFTAYSEATSERVPPAGAGGDMRWHWDAVHVKRVLGDTALERVFGSGAAGAAGGWPLARARLRERLAEIHDQRARYLGANADQLEVLDEAEQQAGVAADPARVHVD